MAAVIEDFVNETAVQGETFDSFAFRIYGEERMSHYIRQYNTQYSDTVIFNGGEELTVPVLSETESKEALAPWRR